MPSKIGYAGFLQTQIVITTFAIRRRLAAAVEMATPTFQPDKVLSRIVFAKLDLPSVSSCFPIVDDDDEASVERLLNIASKS